MRRKGVDAGELRTDVDEVTDVCIGLCGGVVMSAGCRCLLCGCTVQHMTVVAEQMCCQPSALDSGYWTASLLAFAFGKRIT